MMKKNNVPMGILRLDATLQTKGDLTFSFFIKVVLGKGDIMSIAETYVEVKVTLTCLEQSKFEAV